jgi:hypothetical protein
MPSNLFVGVLTWVILTAGVIALAIYRHILARNECDILHLSESEMPLVPRQAAFAKQVDRLDFWGKRLTVVSVGYGFLLGGLLLYWVWQQGPTL